MVVAQTTYVLWWYGNNTLFASRIH